MIKNLVIVLTLALSGCSVLDTITPSGPQVNTNAQVGKENTQQVVANQTNTNVQGDQKTSQVDAQSVQSLEIANQEVPTLFLVLFALGWILPGPREIYKEIKSWFVKDKKDANT